MSFNSPFTGNVIVPTDVSYRSITLSTNTTLEWPVNGNATPNYAARIMNVTATSGSLVLRMPPANQASVGQDALIRNVGATTFTVSDYNGNVIVVVAAGEAKYIYITTNATEAGTWGIIAFGVGSSTVDATSLMGYGLTVIGATLNTGHPVQTIAASYTAVAADRAKTLVWTGGSGTVTLTSSVTLGNNWFILLRNGGTGTLTISPSGGDQINGAATLALQPADSAIICCSGSAFFTVGIGRNTDFNFTQNTKAVTTGSYTLTASEGANPIQKFTGVLTGNVTVTVPQTIAVYYITNQTDGTGAGYTITFSTGVAGSASVVVPAGQQVILVCDSVSLYNASTVTTGSIILSMADGSVSSPSLNFATELTTGLYRPASGQWAVSILGVQRMLLTATGVTFAGDMKANGVVVGRGSGSNPFNTTVGDRALFNNTTGSANSALGLFALGENTVGSNNCAFGSYALQFNTSGASNSAFGVSALYLMQTGSFNVAFGQQALNANVSGQANVALGAAALFKATTSNNTSIGYLSLSELTSGANNVAVGFQAGNALTTGSNNIIIGYDADVSAASVSNEITIGNAGNTSLRVPGLSLTAGIKWINNGTYTVANLLANAPAATVGAGARAVVTDASATTFSSIVGGGGANVVPVYSDGTNWRIG